MPNLTTPIPPRLTGDTSADVGALKRWGTALIDELTYLFNNLDCSNVIEAASVKAENIETRNAKITDAQIGALSADKLVAGSINTGKVKVEDSDGNLSISGSEITISDRDRERFVASYDKSKDLFRFELYNEDGEPTVSINSSGDAVFSGVLEGTKIFSSTIIGTSSDDYNDISGGVFADINQTGIKVMQDKNGSRQQKIGMAVSDDGTAYLILGAGNGNGGNIINGVVYTNGSFKIEKNESHASLGLVGYSPFIYFLEDTGELWLNGVNVLINGINPINQINRLDSQIRDLWDEIDNLRNNINSN